MLKTIYGVCGSGRAVPAASFEMHVVHCERRVARCELCRKPMLTAELEKHMNEMQGSTAALGFACENGDAETVIDMLRHGAEVGTAVNDECDLPLHAGTNSIVYMQYRAHLLCSCTRRHSTNCCGVARCGKNFLSAGLGGHAAPLVRLALLPLTPKTKIACQRGHIYLLNCFCCPGCGTAGYQPPQRDAASHCLRPVQLQRCLRVSLPSYRARSTDGHENCAWRHPRRLEYCSWRQLVGASIRGVS